MSAVYGVIDTAGRTADSAAFERMAAALRHRGPDGLAAYAEGPAALGRALMRVTPESARETPLLRWGPYVAAADARLDERAAMMDRLGLAADARENITDPLLLVMCYDRWGPDFLQDVYGDFALAIWNTESRTGLLARDQMGVRPLFTAEGGGRFAFASELRAVVLSELVEAVPVLERCRLRISGLPAEALRPEPGAVPGSATVWRGVEILPPAHYRLLSDGAIGAPVRYWRPVYAENPAWRDPARALAELRRVTEQAVLDRCRVLGDRVGVELSGGLDSSLIAAVAAGGQGILRGGAAAANGGDEALRVTVSDDTHPPANADVPCPPENGGDLHPADYGGEQQVTVSDDDTPSVAKGGPGPAENGGELKGTVSDDDAQPPVTRTQEPAGLGTRPAPAIYTLSSVVREGEDLPLPPYFDTDERPHIRALLERYPDMQAGYIYHDELEFGGPGLRAAVHRHYDIFNHFYYLDEAFAHRFAQLGCRRVLSGFGGDFTLSNAAIDPVKYLLRQRRYRRALRVFMKIRRHEGGAWWPALREQLLRPLWPEAWRGVPGRIRQIFTRKKPQAIRRRAAMWQLTEEEKAQLRTFREKRLERYRRQDELAEWLHYEGAAPSMTDLDLAAAAGPVEICYPLLDRRLVECLLQMPAEHFRAGGRPRGLIRAVGRTILPDMILYREDKGPYSPGFTAHFRTKADEILLKLRKLERFPELHSWINIRTIESEMSEFVRDDQAIKGNSAWMHLAGMYIFVTLYLEILAKSLTRRI